MTNVWLHYPLASEALPGSQQTDGQYALKMAVL